jgi:hypothetical protein
VAAALALDFTISVPALVYFLLVRARRAPWFAIIPTFVVGCALAMAIIPARHPAVLGVPRLGAVPLELTVVGYLVVLTRRALKGVPRGDGDFVTRLRSVARSVLASRIPADILTTEVAILWYAFRWRRPAPQAPGAFTVHREVGYLTILIGLLFLLLVETIALRVLVSHWGPAASWALTGLSLYAVVWLAGDYRAMAERPTRVTATLLSLRVGVRWEAEIPIDQIVQVDPLKPSEKPPGRDTLVAALLGQPKLRLRLVGPVEVTGMYGIRKTVREIWLGVDQAATLCLQIRNAVASRDPRV